MFVQNREYELGWNKKKDRELIIGMMYNIDIHKNVCKYIYIPCPTGPLFFVGFMF